MQIHASTDCKTELLRGGCSPSLVSELMSGMACESMFVRDGASTDTHQSPERRALSQRGKNGPKFISQILHEDWYTEHA